MPRQTRQCKLCPTLIFFVVSGGGRRMPLDAQETTIVVLDDADEFVKVERGHVPHHITCPEANLFRSKKGKL
jgi:hypothetical protein